MRSSLPGTDVCAHFGRSPRRNEPHPTEPLRHPTSLPRWAVRAKRVTSRAVSDTSSTARRSVPQREQAAPPRSGRGGTDPVSGTGMDRGRHEGTGTDPNGRARRWPRCEPSLPRKSQTAQRSTRPNRLNAATQSRSPNRPGIGPLGAPPGAATQRCAVWCSSTKVPASRCNCAEMRFAAHLVAYLTGALSHRGSVRQRPHLASCRARPRSPSRSS